MRKIYSLVLMATMLLIGTNAWADVHPTQQSSDEAKVKIGNGDWQYARYLKDAFEAVGVGQTAEIVLLKGLNLESPINMPATIPVYESGVNAGKGRLHEVDGQNITLDLAGHNITANDNVTAFRIMKGALDIKGTGTISKAGGGDYNVWQGGAVITIFGTEDSLAVDWSKLTIGKGVTIEMTPSVNKGVGIMIQDHNQSDALDSSDPFKAAHGNYASFKDKFGYGTWDQVSLNTTYNFKCGAVASTSYWQQGSAFGVKVFIDGKVNCGKYGVQITGHVNQKPECMGDSARRHPELYPAPYYKYQYPYIKVSSTATVSSSAVNGSVGIYASGYGVFDINGKVEGATGLYMKASDADVTDAYIRSTSHTPGTSGGGASGVKNAGGSAIVLESNDAYAGGSGLSITGDTRVEGDGGYAIYEETYKEDTDGDGIADSNVSHITIEGGTIQGGGEGAIAITDDTHKKDQAIVTGGNITSQNNTPTVTVGSGDATTAIEVSTLFPNNTEYHTTEVEVNGKTVVVVSQGSAPSSFTTWDAVVTAGAGNWTEIGDNGVTVTLDSDVTLGELQIISGDADHLQTIIIPDEKTLQVNHLMMNDYARIIVNAGGKLIVKGTQGIIAPKEETILLQNEADKPAVFVFRPEVTSNRHPKATVEFLSKGFNNTTTGKFGWQKFGVPTQTEELTDIIIEGNIPTAFGKFNYEAETPAWEIIGYLHHTPALNKADLDHSFEYYQMEHNTAAESTKVTFTGRLVGNDCPALDIRAHFWNGYANSYSAPISGAALLAQIPSPADKAYYLYEWDGLSEKFSWVAKSNLSKKDIQPMQPFLVRNPSDDAVVLDLNYNEAVYVPATTANLAPARREADNMTKAEIVVRGENGVDHLIVAEDAEFSAAFDNGYDVAKYMNDDVNMYVSADEKMAIFATDNLENTYVGFQSVKAGAYTIEFADVQGEELILIDHETGAQVAMMNGNVYTFSAAANSVNDYRFEIVAAAKMPTAIENTEAVKSVKGIYTITGQYVGEMNIWNSLPAGIYVVNGAKRVK